MSHTRPIPPRVGLRKRRWCSACGYMTVEARGFRDRSFVLECCACGREFVCANQYELPLPVDGPSQIQQGPSVKLKAFRGPSMFDVVSLEAHLSSNLQPEEVKRRMRALGDEVVECCTDKLRELKCKHRQCLAKYISFPDIEYSARLTMIKAEIPKLVVRKLKMNEALSTEQYRRAQTLTLLLPWFDKDAARALFRILSHLHPYLKSESTKELGCVLASMVSCWMADEIPLVYEAFCETLLDPKLIQYHQFLTLSHSWWFENLWCASLPLHTRPHAVIYSGVCALTALRMALDKFRGKGRKTAKRFSPQVNALVTTLQSVGSLCAAGDIRAAASFGLLTKETEEGAGAFMAKLEECSLRAMISGLSIEHTPEETFPEESHQSDENTLTDDDRLMSEKVDSLREAIVREDFDNATLNAAEDTNRWFRKRECSRCLCVMQRARFKRCGRCNSVSYCSRLCQKSHWKEHKVACNSRSISQ
eukprot:186323_1